MYVAHYKASVEGKKIAGVFGIFNSYDDAKEKVHNYCMNALKLEEPYCEICETFGDGKAKYRAAYTNPEGFDTYNVKIEYLPTDCVVDIKS